METTLEQNLITHRAVPAAAERRTEDLTGRIRRVFTDHLAITVPAPDTELVESGLLDSLALVNLLMQLENEFGITVAMEELDIEDFRNLDRIADYVRRSSS